MCYVKYWHKVCSFINMSRIYYLLTIIILCSCGTQNIRMSKPSASLTISPAATTLLDVIVGKFPGITVVGDNVANANPRILVRGGSLSINYQLMRYMILTAPFKQSSLIHRSTTGKKYHNIKITSCYKPIWRYGKRWSNCYKIKKMKQILIILLMLFNSSSYETQYELIMSEDEFEIRFYPAALKAKVISTRNANGNFLQTISIY